MYVKDVYKIAHMFYDINQLVNLYREPLWCLLLLMHSMSDLLFNAINRLLKSK